MSNVTIQNSCSQQLEMDSFAVANIVLLLLLFISLGMAISIQEVKRSLQHPKGIILSQIGQFIFLPFLGWSMAKAFGLGVAGAVGLVAVTTAPGGAISNIIAVFWQADIPLSVCSTAVSSVLAIGFMPLNQYIYLIAANLAPGVCLNVSGIILSACIVVAGTGIGLYSINYLEPRKYFKTIKAMYAIGSLSGLAIVIIGFVANLNSKMPITALPGKAAAAALIPYLIGTIFGLVFGTLLKLPRPSRVTVALEIGIQNKIVAISVLTFIFPANSAQRAASFAMPLIYALFATTISFVWVGISWKLGWTNLPKEKGYIEAFKIARAKATELNNLENQNEDKGKAAVESVTSAPSTNFEPKSKASNSSAVLAGDDGVSNV